MTQDIVERAKSAMADHEAFIVAQGGRVVSPGLMPELVARIEADADTITALRAEVKKLTEERDECNIYLKEGETPRQRMDRDHADVLSLMELLAREKLHTKNANDRADAAEAKLAALEPKGKEAW